MSDSRRGEVISKVERNERLRARREAMPSQRCPGEWMSRQELAMRVNVLVAEYTGRPGALDANYVGKLERGVIGWPRQEYRRALRYLLDASTDTELGFVRPVRGSLAGHGPNTARTDPGGAGADSEGDGEGDGDSREPGSPADGAGSAEGVESGGSGSGGSGDGDGGDGGDSSVPAVSSRAAFESLFAIARRVHRLTTSNVSAAGVAQIGQMIETAVAEYERLGPARLLTEVLPQRHWLDELLGQTQPPKDRLVLYDAAARLSGVLANMALDLGSQHIGRGYAAEAFSLAELVGDPDLQAWARGIQSLIEYYDGRFPDAVELARDGLRISPRGPLALRLAVNGEARALARLGRVREMEAAMDNAFSLLADHPTRPGQISTSLGFGPYCPARLAGNAATGYLWAGQIAKAVELSESTLSTWDDAGFSGPRSLTRIDLAMAELRATDPQLERAADLVLQALEISPKYQFGPIWIRAEEFMAEAARFGDVPALREVRERLRDSHSQT